MLRKALQGGTFSWSDEELVAGFKKFYEVNGHYPNAYEVDQFEYLPSSRSIQRSYGGLVVLRKRLFPDAISSYTSGEYRKKVASDMYKRAQVYEERFYDKLCTIFQEIAIHEQKRIRPGSVASDFFVYLNPLEGVCIDTFYAKDIRSIANIVNIKLKRYAPLKCKVLLVVISEFGLNQQMIDAQVANRSNHLPEHVSVVTEDYFWGKSIKQMSEASRYLANFTH